MLEYLEKEKDTTLSDFVLQCATAFGGFGSKLDDLSDIFKLNPLKVAPYLSQWIKETETEIEEAEGWSKYSADEKAKEKYRNEVKNIGAFIEEERLKALAFLRMLGKVLNWVPPRKDHHALKNLMVRRLIDGISDCMKFPTLPLQLTGEEYRQKIISNARANLLNHRASFEKEQKRVKKENDWIKVLKRSLANVEPL